MAPPFPLSDRASDVRPGCKTQRIVPTLRQVADLMCARIKEREYFKTNIVGHVNCCLQCAPTLRRRPFSFIALFPSPRINRITVIKTISPTHNILTPHHTG
ncbi:hypothetical protein PoB_006779600 [Plakobranchus ocellatus]|uniref:Uncharacterized protein n=1 Tax=Plakobranchus ocellatus TaxID=259542 RepID=A0AAV4DAX2_9GAST|nr:hypothetical protein PoB_006779600 [Plakobranchus ocellatus]